MLPTGDNRVIQEITLHYCLASFGIYSFTSAILYFTDFYLLAGQREFLQLHAIFVVTEIVKWIYHKVALEKDVRVTYKKKPLPFFSLLIKCFDIIHLLKSFIVAILGSFAYHFLAVVFGADIISKYEETYIFSLFMSVLTIFPLCLNFGVSSIAYMLSGLKPSNSLHQLVHRNFQFTVFGAWSGAVVIPLDWDRPWQMWPIPCTFGALIACSFSYLILYLHLYLVSSNFSILKKLKF